ncbi:hypothetical protein SISNIDRAFT_458370 [Sistotremastrum niveocremeum HHB9708]|uniref:HORMA domain-containing protein n=2 Tax=Sistotremastraceae TaxID=3402574 RepID=A0A164QWM1_9AGAM|nr:hypothetical protein SISNIDRAFT_458370 [Sistotremastrum niveocremeum HHB9708]KZT39267.1 hypothetical protein SISSUDRAFT_1045889 [Sistotremastrum suecicum HHB10207 ss-3]
MMLLAGFGSIAKNRELFPEENFADKRLQGGEFPDSAKFLPGSQGSQSGRSVASGMRVTLVKRDYTPEANQLLDYLEKGIFDALERRFLRSFIFAIYLDKENPNDIIEAYTFSFSYRKVAGSDQIVPVLSLGQQLDNLSLGQAVCIDPTPGQSAGNPPTLGQAKQSIKALLTCLTNNVKNFDALPTRRYATFKMYYTDNTPDDYEPPFFHKGDAEADKFTFNTHTSLEQPETLDVGSADTGHHTVQVHMASITSFLPSRDANDAALLGFVGHDNAQHPSALTPMQIDEIRAQQAAAQIDDAQKRVVPWDAEDTTSLSIQRSVSDQDADGEPDPEFASANDSVGDHSLRMDLDETPNEAVPVIAGALEHVPAHVAKLSDGHGISETQSTQILLENSHRLPDSMRSTEPSHGLDTMELRDMITSKAAARKVIHPQEGKDEIAGKMSHLMSIDDENEHAIDCSCEVQDEDDGLCQCEGPCHRWFHIWCMGYHDITDPRMPDHFICLKCRVESDEKFPLIKGTSRYGNILENFKELALLRRSIKYVERECPDSLTQFKRLIGTVSHLLLEGPGSSW